MSVQGVLRVVGRLEEDSDTVIHDLSAEFDPSKDTKEEYAERWANQLEEEFTWHNVIYSWFIEGIDVMFHHTPANTLHYREDYSKGYKLAKRFRLEVEEE